MPTFHLKFHTSSKERDPSSRLTTKWGYFSPLLILSLLVLARSASAQVTNGAWVYPSPNGNLLYQLDERGQRVSDFSNCGYKGGTEPLPNVFSQIDQSRWVYVSPGSTNDTAMIQAAINTVSAKSLDSSGWRGVVYLNPGEYQVTNTLTISASGVVLKGAGSDPSTGTRLRATTPTQYTLIKVTTTNYRSVTSNTAHNLTQTLVPAGTRTFQVDSTSGLTVGQGVIVRRPSTTNWITDINMDQLLLDATTGNTPWYANTKNLSFDRIITRIDSNWITVDAPIPQTFESKYGSGQIWPYTWTGRLQQVGIEDVYGFSDYASPTDENHAWTFIDMGNMQNGWVRNITSQYFGYSAVLLRDGAKWVTVTDSKCLDPISIITGSRRYSFNNDGAEQTLFVNNYARQGRHNFVFGSLVPGPNAFVQSTADTSYSDAGPHHRWSTGGLFDVIKINGNELNAQNRGNMGTGHGWSGAYMTVWNSVATSFRVRNPPTARNWLIGSVGSILPSSNPVGVDPEGTYDSSGTAGKAVFPYSLYYGQLQQRMKWPSSEFREVWIGDIDQFSSTNGLGETVDCNSNWLAQLRGLGGAVDSKFDYLVGGRTTAFTFTPPIDAGSTVVAASLTISIRAVGNTASDFVMVDTTNTPMSFSSLGWTPVSTNSSSVRTLEVDPSLLSDGILNVAVGTNSAVDFAVLHMQVQKSQPTTHTVNITPEADAMVQGGASSVKNYGATSTLEISDTVAVSTNREAFIRWNLSGVTGTVIQAKVRLSGTVTGQFGNENAAALTTANDWDEKELIFSNKPSSGAVFAQWLPVTGKASEFDATSQINSSLSNDKKLSLRILSTGSFGAQGGVSYASKESSVPADRPQLVVTFSGSNTAPTIGDLPDVSVKSGASTGIIPVAVGDTTTPAEFLVLSASSSDANLIPSNNILLGGSGANRTVTIIPQPNHSGSAVITLTVSDGTLTASKSFTVTVLPLTPATITLSQNNPTYDGTAKSVIVSTIPPNLAVALTYNGSSNAPTDAGSYSVVCSIADANYEGSASNAFVISKALAKITFSGTNKPYNGYTRSVIINTAPPNLTTTLTYNGSPNPPSALGSYPLIASISDSNYEGSNTGTLLIYDAVALWRFNNFGSSDNSGVSADSADPNGNGLSNLQEYTLGTDPTSPSTRALMTTSYSNNMFTLAFTAREASSNAGYSGLNRYYNLESTTNLADASSWVCLPGYSNIMGTNQTVTFSTNVSLTTKWFYRLRAWLQ